MLNSTKNTMLFEKLQKVKKNRRKFESEYVDPLANEEIDEEMEVPQYGDPMVANQTKRPVMIPNGEVLEEDDDLVSDEYVYETDEDEEEMDDIEGEDDFEDEEEYTTLNEDGDEFVDENGNTVEFEEEPEEDEDVDVVVNTESLKKKLNILIRGKRKLDRVQKIESVKSTRKGFFIECVVLNPTTKRAKRETYLLKGGLPVKESKQYKNKKRLMNSKKRSK